ncbi:MAG: hypothetical protein WBC22_01100, partial [Sedimentisphaerales bacterium]
MKTVVRDYLIISCIATVLLVVLFGPVHAEKATDHSLLTLERIYDSNDFEPEKFGPARWLENGSGYTTLEDTEAQQECNEPSACDESDDEKPEDIVRYAPDTGRREIIVPSTRLIPPGESEPLKIDDYSWSDDGKKLLVFTNTKRVWR